ncbi:MAG: fumarylacetoacetate hydrolase family protein [Xanthobacteraceae bacterium]|nr:fumarylacetoacetate hydrolase family protein [Xanthobacteraceae bacterium]MBV9628524.1 fumarylacetoacetate hydrolase family protein [Xanthobacteraceae bacterium]
MRDRACNGWRVPTENGVSWPLEPPTNGTILRIVEFPPDVGWKFEDCIAHVSRGETVVPGDFFGSGSVGNGCGLEQMRFVKSGDVVELEVEGIGVLRNRVLRD